jgi:hypothetical protein
MSTSDRQPPRLSLRSPDDVIAIVPYLIGFDPEESLVAIGLTGKTVGFTGRVDLPTDTAELPDYRYVVEHLAAATARNATACILVAYGPATIVTAVMDLARQAMTASGLPVLEALRVTDDRYFSYVCDDPTCCPAEGKPVAGQGTRVQVAAVFAGMTTRPNRADLAASIAPHTGPRRQQMNHAAQKAAQQLSDELGSIDSSSGTEQTHALVRRRGIAAVGRAFAQHRAGQALSDDDAATLLILLHNLTVRDHAMLRTEATDAALWTDLTRRASDDLAASAATLLAYAAWLRGDGALANIALDRADNADPEYTMAHLLRHALHAGVHPSLFHDWLVQAAATHQPSPTPGEESGDTTVVV